MIQAKEVDTSIILFIHNGDKIEFTKTHGRQLTTLILIYFLFSFILILLLFFIYLFILILLVLNHFKERDNIMQN